MQRIDSTLSQKIANAGFVCACLVVTIHLSHPKTGGGVWLDRLLAGGISNVAVPIFFAISGFLLAGKIGEPGWWRRELSKRVRTLLVPFCVWGLISFVVAAGLSVNVDIRKGQFPLTTFLREFDWRNAFVSITGIDLTGMPVVGALWYVRNLFILVVVSPIVLGLVRRWGWRWIYFAFFLYLFWRSATPLMPTEINGFFWYGFSLQGLLCFSLGAKLRMGEGCPLALRPWVQRACWILGFGCWFLTQFINLSACMGNAVIVLEILFLSCALWSAIPSRPWPRGLVGTAFPIYLMHQIIIGVLGSFPRLVPDTGTLLGFLLFWIVPIAVAIIATAIVRKLSPKLVFVLFGGRS